MKVKKRVPCGKVVFHIKKEKPRKARCAICKKPLHGVPSLIPSQLKKLPKSKRRPSRPYGGYLCSSCTREILREKARGV